MDQREQTAAIILAALIESYDLARNGGRPIDPVLQSLASQAVRTADALRMELATTKAPNPRLAAEQPGRSP